MKWMYVVLVTMFTCACSTPQVKSDAALHTSKFDIAKIESQLKQGDLIFRLTTSPDSLAVAKVSNSLFSHVGIVRRLSTGGVKIFDVIPSRNPAVHSSTVEEFFSGKTYIHRDLSSKLVILTFLDNSRKQVTYTDAVLNFVVLRFDNLNELESESISKRLADIRDIAVWDKEYTLDNGTPQEMPLYCAELAYEAYRPILKARGIVFPFTPVSEVQLRSKEVADFLRSNKNLIARSSPSSMDWKSLGDLFKSEDDFAAEMINQAIEVQVKPIMRLHALKQDSPIVTSRDFMRLPSFKVVRIDGVSSVNPAFSNIIVDGNVKYESWFENFLISYTRDVTNGYPTDALPTELMSKILERAVRVSPN